MVGVHLSQAFDAWKTTTGTKPLQTLPVLQTSSIHQVVVTRHPPRNKVLSEHLFYARASKDRRRSPPTNETLYSFLRAPPVSDVDINKPTTRQTDPSKTKYMEKKKVA